MLIILDPSPYPWRLRVGKHIRGYVAPTVVTHILTPLIRQARKEHGSFQKQHGTKIFGYLFLTPRVFGPDLCRYRSLREALRPDTVSLTCRGPGAALPSHRAVLLVFINAHTQEGPFYIFTEGFTTHATEQLTFVHIWKREHRSSQTCSSLLTALCFTSCAKTSGVCWKQGDPLGAIKPFSYLGEGAPRGRAESFGLCERTVKTQSKVSKLRSWL